MRIGSFETHPAADVFPMIEGSDFMALVDDIRQHGLQDPVVLSREDSPRIVDGRNRARACFELGFEPATVKLEKEWDPVRYVVAKNLHRRHLTPSQRAIVADRLADLGHGQRQRHNPGSATQADAGKLLHVSDRTIRKVRELKARGREDLHDEVAKGKKTLNRAVREARRDESAEKLRAKPTPPPDGPFDVVALDPPWRYTKNQTMGDAERRGEVDYPDMSVEEIIALDVPRLLSEHAIVWLWTTNAHIITEAPKIIEAWGLTPKTVLTWKKPRIGGGDWLRGQTEHAILCVRGKPTVTLSAQSTVIEAATREHSRKPEQFYELVESLCPGNKLELFARERRDGWTSHGVDLDRFKEPQDSGQLALVPSDVVVGNVYEDRDPRRPGRRVVVTAIDGEIATIQSLSTGVVSQIATTSLGMATEKRGYAFIGRQEHTTAA